VRCASCRGRTEFIIHTHTHIYILLYSSAYKSLVCEWREGAGRACVCVCVCARESKSRASVAESGGLCWAQVYRCGFARPSIKPIEFLPIDTHTHTYYI